MLKYIKMVGLWYVLTYFDILYVKLVMCKTWHSTKKKGNDSIIMLSGWMLQRMRFLASETVFRCLYIYFLVSPSYNLCE